MASRRWLVNGTTRVVYRNRIYNTPFRSSLKSPEPSESEAVGGNLPDAKPAALHFRRWHFAIDRR
jgi:hypothetical protein